MNDFDDIPFEPSNELNQASFSSNEPSLDDLPFSDEVVPQVTDNNIFNSII